MNDRSSSAAARLLSLLLAPLALLAGCVSDGYPEPPSGGDVSAYEYVIGEGDTLNIFVWGSPDLSASVPVRPDGRITTRLVEDLKASGRTPTQLARGKHGKEHRGHIQVAFSRGVDDGNHVGHRRT